MSNERRSIENENKFQMKENPDDYQELPINIAFVHNVEDTAAGKILTDEERVEFRRKFDEHMRQLDATKRTERNGAIPKNNSRPLATERYVQIAHPENYYTTLSGPVGNVAKAVTRIVVTRSEIKDEKSLQAGNSFVENTEDTLKSILTPKIQTPEQQKRVIRAKQHLLSDQKLELCPHCVDLYVMYAAKHIERLNSDAESLEKSGAGQPHAFLYQKRKTA